MQHTTSTLRLTRPITNHPTATLRCSPNPNFHIRQRTALTLTSTTVTLTLTHSCLFLTLIHLLHRMDLPLVYLPQRRQSCDV